jgi:tetratricopeptide (TPR) repeat protein
LGGANMIEQRPGTVFVGREQELGELLKALDDAVAGRGRLVLIGGEPGIGKSRLADELAHRARAAGYPVLWGRGWEDAGAPPYWPWVQALRSHVRGTDPAEVRRQVGSGAGDIAQMLPELRDIFDDLALPPETGSESARFRLFDSTTTFLRNAALQGPMLLVIDDLQAADTPSILFLQFLATQLSDMRVLVVGTYRDVALTPEHPLTSAIAELSREPITDTMTLSGLQGGALGEFIGATAGRTPPAHLVSAVLRETKGNPLFVGEAVRLLSAEGRLNEVADLPSLRVAVPAGVRAVIARRIGHLGGASEHALAYGAAVGPEFSVEVLRRIADSDADELQGLLDEAVRAGLLQPITGVSGRYRFSHDLVRETLYDELTPGRRVRLHQRIAEVLEERYGASPDAHLDELAFHFYEAAQGIDSSTDPAETSRWLAKAADYARRAGERASRALAYEEASRLFRMALAVFNRAASPDEEELTEILLALGDVDARAGDLTSSSATFQEAATLARRTGNARHLARAALGYGGRIPWLRPGQDTRLIPMLQDALVLLGGSDDRLRVRLLTRLACAWRSSPDQREQSATHARQAVDLARQQNDPATLSYALAGSFWATWWPETPDQRFPIAEEMVAVAEAAGDAERIMDAHLMLEMAYVDLGRMAEARAKLEDVIRLSSDLRQPAQMWLGVAPRALVALLDGDFGLAEELLERELAWASPLTPIRDETSAARFHLFLLRREQGRVAEAESAVRASIEEFPWYPLHRAALACLLHDLGRDSEARSVLNDLAQREFHALYRDNEWLLGMGLASDACASLGDAEAAAVLYEQLIPFAGRHAVGHGEGSVGAVDRYLGLLAATIGRLDDAERHFSDAIRLNAQMGALPWTAHSQDDLARLLLQRNEAGDRERANELQLVALETARRLGMVALEARIADRQAGGLEPPGAPPTAVVGVFRAEGEYWTVVFEGKPFRMRDAKGLRYLARLLANPGREQHALDLARMDHVGPSTAPGDADLNADRHGDAGVLLDPEAKAAYRRRLDELQSEVDEADAFNDSERAARARQEIEFLTDELAGAVGLGGRDRTAASAAERARISVTRAIRSAMSRIAEQSPALGRHFEATIRTGTFCSYNPDPRVPMSWEI